MASAAETSSQEEEMASQSHERAEAALLEGQYSKAFAHYMLVIRLQPAKKAGNIHVFKDKAFVIHDFCKNLEISDVNVP